MTAPPPRTPSRAAAADADTGRAVDLVSSTRGPVSGRLPEIAAALVPSGTSTSPNRTGRGCASSTAPSSRSCSPTPSGHDRSGSPTAGSAAGAAGGRSPQCGVPSGRSEAALAVYAELGQDSDGAAQAEHNLGVARTRVGDHEAARRHLARARAVYRRSGRRREAAEVVVDLVIAAAAEGDLAKARRYYRRAFRDLREQGVWPALVRAVHDLDLTFPPASAARRDRVLPAWLALDAVRFTLPSAAERSRWRDSIGAPRDGRVRQRGTSQPAAARRGHRAGTDDRRRGGDGTGDRHRSRRRRRNP